MKKTLYIAITITVLGTLLFSCSTKKDTFINRSFHSVTTKYNVLFNGKVAFDEGKEALINSYVDNYWEVLPVERMEVKDVIALPGQGENPNFKKAEEKAVKAIQKHSMEINGRQRNPQMDEAYLLLGQARYFDQRFIPALEAFNYIIGEYPDSDKINEVRIWREKTHLRLENDEFAIANLKRILKDKLDDQNYADANAFLGQAYINLKHKDSAIYALKRAVATTKNREEEGRYNYIIGQLYNELGHKDSANMAFDKVIDLNRKSPRIYMINAHVEKIKNFDMENGDKEELLEHLTDLEEDRENRPFLDRIYRQIGEFHLYNDSLELAELYFNKSVRKATTDKYLKALDYENLAALRFDEAKYKDAGAYYDSTLRNLKKNTKKFRRIEKKKNNLKDVIAYEDVAHKNDSILKIVNLSEAERTEFFQSYIDELKAAEEAKKALEEQKSNFVANEFANSRNNVNNGSGGFYFYNPTTVAYGKNEFRKRWGDRVLEDDWRLSDKRVIQSSGVGNASVAQKEEKTKEDLYSVAYYTDQIPTDEKVIDSIGKERNFAYYQLGLIYKEKFKEYELAASRLETLLQNNPEEKLILPSKYNLYKIYTILESSKADDYKNDIISNHPSSRYAQILKNPQQVLASDENSPESLYAKTYQKFVNQDYENALADTDKYISQFTGEEIAPKFEMLKAITIARLDGYEAYKEALNYVALNYPNNEEGKRAQEIINTSLPKMKQKIMVPDEEAKHFKIIYTFNTEDKEQIEEFDKKIKEILEDLKYGWITVSHDVYNRKQRFVVIHGFNSKIAALSFKNTVENNPKYLLKKDHLIISSENYRTIQIHKNLAEIN